MRLLRFIGLTAAIAAVYFAQYIFDFRSLAEFFPDFALRLFPQLVDYTHWLASDLLVWAMIMTIVGGLGFGLLAPTWRGALDGPARAATLPHAHSDRQSQLFLAMAGVGALFCLLYLWLRSGEHPVLWLLWALTLVNLVVGLILRDRARAYSPASQPAPRSGWVGIILVMAAAGFLFGWQLAAMPMALEDGLSEFGLTALGLATGRLGGLFAPGPQGLPMLSHWPTAFFMFIGNNVLLEMRLSGLVGGFVTVFATWLLGRELFLRPPLHDDEDEIVEDDGGWMALLAAALLALAYGTVHFSRLPHYIEPAAWGTAGLWLLARGLRRGSWLNCGLSALLFGLAAAAGPAGLVFPIVGLLWWLGVALLRPTMAGRTGSHFYSWLLSLFVVAAPLVGTWLHAPDRFVAWLRAPALLDAVAYLPDATLFGLNLRRTLFAFNYAADTSSVFGLPTHLLHSLLAPLLVLAVGALLVNLDTWSGWSLLSWAVIGALIAAWLSPRAPFAPLLTPLFPAVALMMAFAIDRVRATAVASAGAWIGQAVVILALGVIGWAGVNSWITYYQYANTGRGNANDVTSAMARAAHEGDDAGVLALVNSYGSQPLGWDQPAFRLVSADLPKDQQRIIIAPNAWPAVVIEGTRFLIQPTDRALLDEIDARYPGGVVSVARDLRGNPRVYIVDW